MQAVFSTFSSASPDLDDAFDQLSGTIRESPQRVEAAAQYYLEAQDPHVRFAALYALANTASSERALEALRGLLDHSDVTYRLLAAAGLVTGGVKDGIPVLIEGLRSDEELTFSQPPMRAWRYAQNLLTLYVNQDLGLMAAEDFNTAQAAAAAWEAWWQQVQADIVWDAASGEFTWGP
jgi:hypothetical protein